MLRICGSLHNRTLACLVGRIEHTCIIAMRFEILCHGGSKTVVFAAQHDLASLALCLNTVCPFSGKIANRAFAFQKRSGKTGRADSILFSESFARGIAQPFKGLVIPHLPCPLHLRLEAVSATAQFTVHLVSCILVGRTTQGFIAFAKRVQDCFCALIFVNNASRLGNALNRRRDSVLCAGRGVHKDVAYDVAHMGAHIAQHTQVTPRCNLVHESCFRVQLLSKLPVHSLLNPIALFVVGHILNLVNVVIYTFQRVKVNLLNAGCKLQQTIIVVCTLVPSQHTCSQSPLLLFGNGNLVLLRQLLHAGRSFIHPGNGVHAAGQVLPAFTKQLLGFRCKVVRELGQLLFCAVAEFFVRICTDDFMNHVLGFFGNAVAGQPPRICLQITACFASAFSLFTSPRGISGLRHKILVRTRLDILPLALQFLLDDISRISVGLVPRAFLPPQTGHFCV